MKGVAKIDQVSSIDTNGNIGNGASFAAPLPIS